MATARKPTPTSTSAKKYAPRVGTGSNKGRGGSNDGKVIYGGPGVPKPNGGNNKGRGGTRAR